MTMKFSEAIRLGAMLAPQGFGQFKNAAGATCAMGAAREAGYPVEEDRLGNAIETPLTLGAHTCPAATRQKDCSPWLLANQLGLYLYIQHLNDFHRWSREQIADWVATIEAAQEVAPPIQSSSEDLVPMEQSR